MFVCACACLCICGCVRMSACMNVYTCAPMGACVVCVSAHMRVLVSVCGVCISCVCASKIGGYPEQELLSLLQTTYLTRMCQKLVL